MGAYTLADILEPSLDELIVNIANEDPFSSIECFYGHCLIHYHRGEKDALAELQKHGAEFFHKKNQTKEWDTINYLLRLRWASRAGTMEQTLLSEADERAAQAGRWHGEMAMLVGHGHTQLDNHRSAKDWFKLAAKELKKIGCNKKSLRSMLNAIVAETHIDKKANFISKYFDLYKSAEKAGGDPTIACICLLNISREYQLIGSPTAALKYATQALDSAHSTFGSQQYFLVLVHRAQVLCELGYFADARVDYELACTSTHKEVRSALEKVYEILSNHFEDLNPISGDPKNLLPSWREHRGVGKKAELSELETQLVEFLGTGPKVTVDILEHLYGPLLEHEVKVNRFKSLLGNLRRKKPHLIVREKGAYRLADSFQPPKKANDVA